MRPLRMMILKNWNGTQAVPYKKYDFFLGWETYTLSVSFADSAPRGRAKWGCRLPSQPVETCPLPSQSASLTALPKGEPSKDIL